MKRTTLVIALWAVFVATVSAQKAGSEPQLAKEANEYFVSGDFLKAYPLYSQLVSLYPQNVDYSYRFGACAIYSDPDKSKAIKFLTSATKRNVTDPMAWFYLGKAFHLNYQFKDAVKAYETFVTKADPKLVEKLNAQREIETCIYGSNLLANIKDLVVLNKVEADRENFFRYMDLDGIGGKILTVPAELQSKLDQKAGAPGVIHYPGNSTTIYFSSYGKDGTTGKDIYKAQILPDGKFSEPQKVRGDVNTKYDEDFCFLHSDGKTLYFASKGHNSMGGYDIFKSVMDPKSGDFGPAINLDFAINTPDDDIFYIADSLNQKAYFASGRSSDQKHLHVYNVKVQGIPLQIVYLKGSFVSEIDAEQKNATIQIRESMTGRMVMENTTQPSDGNYTLYVPKGGDYKFYIKTENSPVVHESEVKVPSFDKPVALRQEMKLVKESGQERLIVTNYFEEILNEDIAALAAEMLRRKAGLEVNDSPIPSGDSAPVEANNLSVEKTMENVTLAAGFGSDVTIATVIGDIEKDINKNATFIKDTESRINTAYSFALNKQKEAETLTAKAEGLRAGLTGYTTTEDVAKLKESQALLNKAQELKREAKAAIVAASSLQKEVEIAKAEKTALTEDVAAIKAAQAENNFDKTLATLQKEKDRIVANRMAKPEPLAEMTKAAKEKENQLHNSEDKLNNLRQSEKEKEQEIAALETKKSNTKKKSELAEIETAVVNAKSDLDGMRRAIKDRIYLTEKMGKETKDAYAAADVYGKLIQNDKLGVDQTAVLEEAQQNALSMKVDALDTRFEKLVITDPQTLALITDGNTDNSLTSEVAINVRAENENGNENENENENRNADVAMVNTNSQNSIPKSQSVNTNSQNTTTNSQSLNTNSQSLNTNSQNPIPNSGTTVDTATLTPTPTPTPTPSPTTPATPTASGNNGYASIKTSTDAAIKKTSGNTPAMKDARQMVANAAYAQTETRIQEIQKKRASGITEEEKQELQSLIAYKQELKASMPSASVTNAPAERVKAVSTSIDPEYAGKMVDFENMEGTEIEKTIARVGYQETTLAKLEQARIENAWKINTVNNESEIATLAARDKELQSVISTLKKETNDVNTFKAAYDLENKEILNNQNLNERLEDQVVLTQSYMNTLEAFEAKKQEQLAMSTDLAESEQIRKDISVIKQEYQVANAKLTSYQSDLRLTAAAAAPANNDSSVVMNQNLEESIDASTSAEVTNNGDNDSPNSKAEEKPLTKEQILARDADKMKVLFKAKSEQESIFAYESKDMSKLMEKYPEYTSDMQDQDKIDAIQDEILIVEAEVEAASSNAQAKKLDRKAEDLYYKKAQMEIRNNRSVANMTRAEYDAMNAKVNELNTNNQEDLNSRVMLRDEVQKLQNQASANYEEAQELRKKAVNFEDPIEQNDYYRQAFAKEALAINQLQQVVDIHDNMELFLAYSDQELTDLRYNNVAPATTATSDGGTEGLSDGSTEVRRDGSTEGLSDGSTEVRRDGVTEGRSDAEVASVVGAERNTSTNTERSATIGADRTAATSTERTATTSADGTAATSTERSATTSADGTAATSADRTAATSAGRTANAERTSSAASAGRDAGRAASASERAAAADAGYYENAQADDYYYELPTTLSKNLFVRTGRTVYSTSNPIPVSPVMPEGTYYSVQIGAFRNPIPQNLFDEFAPVIGDKLSSGITRYIAGFFMTFDQADDIKMEIRRLGYNDAFVVAYRNGKRVPLYEAMAVTEPDALASMEKEYAYGDGGVAPSQRVKDMNGNVNARAEENIAAERNATNGTSAKAPSVDGKRTDYYKGVPNAVAATQVETVKGLFYTVQIGVYSKPVPASNIKNISPVNSELTANNKIRYTSGIYNNLDAAVNQRNVAKGIGINDAFITAYYNGEKITLSEADRLIKENGTTILVK
jgi:hypothetical protein